jgi:hypothetical protein
MWRIVAIVAAAWLVAACGSTGSTGSTVRRGAGPAMVAGGCGATKLDRGPVPAWTAPAFSDSGPNSPPWPHALSGRGNVVAIVFGYPLRAGDPADRTNKILWIMRLPRHGSPLTVEARPLHANAPLITHHWPADSSPGEIYPSYVNVPTAGCWRLTVRWAQHTDWIDLRYEA